MTADLPVPGSPTLQNWIDQAAGHLIGCPCFRGGAVNVPTPYLVWGHPEHLAAFESGEADTAEPANWATWYGWCDWRIEMAGRVVASGDSERRTRNSAIQMHFVGFRVVSVLVASPAWDLTLTVDSGARLVTFGDHMAEGSRNWSLCAGRYWLETGPAEQWSVNYPVPLEDLARVSSANVRRAKEEAARKYQQAIEHWKSQVGPDGVKAWTTYARNSELYQRRREAYDSATSAYSEALAAWEADESLDHPGEPPTAPRKPTRPDRWPPPPTA